MDDLKVGSMKIQSKVMKFSGSVISIANISRVTTFVPKPVFPLAAAIILAGEVLIAVIALGNLRTGAALLVVGPAAAAIGGLWIYSRISRVKRAPKGLTMSLNSGKTATHRDCSCGVGMGVC